MTTAATRKAEIAARAERVRAVVEGAHGRVTAQRRNHMEFELPADVSGSTLPMLTMSGLRPVHRDQTTRLAPRRVTDLQGSIVLCDNDLVTTAFYRYSVDLRPGSAVSPSAAAPGVEACGGLP
jgi:hypothetical protein